jgi:hypothetical protein
MARQVTCARAVELPFRGGHRVLQASAQPLQRDRPMHLGITGAEERPVKVRRCAAELSSPVTGRRAGWWGDGYQEMG